MPPPAPRRPAIILILADNLGGGDLGSYGQTKIKTPNLDRLAAGGIRFTSFYAGSPDETAARAALFTGLEPAHLHAGFNQALPSGVVTLPAQLKQLGYHNGLIGEWALGDNGAATPDKVGFDEFAGFLSREHAQDFFSDRIWRHDALTQNAGQLVFPENEGGKHGRFMPDLLASAAVNFVKNNKPDQFNHYRPFFFCLAFPLVRAAGHSDAPTDPQYADAPWPPLQRIRASLISHMDAGIGKLLDKLDELKISTNTIVCFAGVNGPLPENGIAPEFFNSAGAFRGAHGGVYEGGLRVPLIVRWPARIKPGRVSDLPGAAWDLLPTATELALAKPPAGLDGISLLPTLFDRKQTAQHEILRWQSAGKDAQLAARLGDWKIVRTNATAAFELYNLRTDAGEKENLAEKKPDELKKIKKALGGPQ